MSGAKKAICVAMILVVAVPLAMSEDLGFTVGLDVALGDVLSGVAVEVTPWVEWSGSLSVLDLYLYADYDNTLVAGSGAGSDTLEEKVSYSLGEDVSVTLYLDNSNTISLDAPVSVSGTLEPGVDLSAGMFYGTVACPIDYTPAPVKVYPYVTAGLAGDNWDADVTLDFTVSPTFSWDDVVLYGDYTISNVTLSLEATLPSAFDVLTLSPWVDVSLLEDALTLGGGVDVDVPLSGGDFTLSPSFSVSYSF
jgi:hypothetical protein